MKKDGHIIPLWRERVTNSNNLSMWIQKQGGLGMVLARLLLGVVFIYASLDKIAHPAAFAEAVYNYQILPNSVVSIVAIVLPWLELTLGIFLLFGVFPEGTLFVVTVLLGAFLGALLYNAIRGLDIHCGCFHTSTEKASRTLMAWYGIRDFIFFSIALFALMKRLSLSRYISRHTKT